MRGSALRFPRVRRRCFAGFAGQGLAGAFLPRAPRLVRRAKSRAKGKRSGPTASLAMRLSEIPLWPGAHTPVPRGPSPRRCRPSLTLHCVLRSRNGEAG